MCDLSQRIYHLSPRRKRGIFQQPKKPTHQNADTTVLSQEPTVRKRNQQQDAAVRTDPKSLYGRSSDATRSLSGAVGLDSPPDCARQAWFHSAGYSAHFRSPDDRTSSMVQSGKSIWQTLLSGGGTSADGRFHSHAVRKPPVPSPESNARTVAVELDSLFDSFSTPVRAKQRRRSGANCSRYGFGQFQNPTHRSRRLRDVAAQPTTSC